MRLSYLLIGLSSLLLTHPIEAGEFNPMQPLLQGQAFEEGIARAQQEGQAQRESPPRLFTPLGQIQRVPRVTNPYSPYLGLPADVAEGLYLQQIQEMQRQIDRLEQQQRR